MEKHPLLRMAQCTTVRELPVQPCPCSPRSTSLNLSQSQTPGEPHPCQPWPPRIHFLSLRICLTIYIFHINGIIQCVTLRVWLCHLASCSRCIPVIAWVMPPSFSGLNTIPLCGWATWRVPAPSVPLGLFPPFGHRGQGCCEHGRTRFVSVSAYAKRITELYGNCANLLGGHQTRPLVVKLEVRVSLDPSNPLFL